VAHAGKSDRASSRTVCVREKVRPGTGREAGLGHDAFELTGMYLKRVLEGVRSLSAGAPGGTAMQNNSDKIIE
jgi:hypothetical protein